jgi:hypothetical protein
MKDENLGADARLADSGVCKLRNRGMDRLAELHESIVRRDAAQAAILRLAPYALTVSAFSFSA